MLAHIPRLPLSLDPLIAEAKRRARQRRFRVAVAALLVAAAGAGAGIVAFSSYSSYVATRPIQAAAGASVTGLFQPTKLLQGGRRIPSPYFGITVFLRNGSAEPVTLEGVRAVLSGRAALRQIGTKFSLFMPEVCPPGSFCQINMDVGGADAHRPFGAERFSPLSVPPGHTAQGQLNFRIAACTGRSLQEAVSIRKITVVYRLPDGTQIHQHPRLRVGFPPDPVVSSTGAAEAWTGTLPNNHLASAIGNITTRACHH